MPHTGLTYLRVFFRGGLSGLYDPYDVLLPDSFKFRKHYIIVLIKDVGTTMTTCFLVVRFQDMDVPFRHSENKCGCCFQHNFRAIRNLVAEICPACRGSGMPKGE